MRAVFTKPEDFLGCIVQGETAPSRMIGNVLKAEMGGLTKENFISIFAVTNLPLWPEARTEQVNQTPRLRYMCMQIVTRAPESASFGWFGKKKLSLLF